MQNIKIYEDGNRVVVVFENSNASIKNMIQNMIGNITAKQVQETLVPNIPEDKDMPEIQKMQEVKINNNENNAVTDFDAWAYIKKYGMAGLEKCYENFDKFDENIKEKISEAGVAYTKNLLRLDEKEMNRTQKINFIFYGKNYVFGTQLNEILSCLGFCTIEDFLQNASDEIVNEVYHSLIINLGERAGLIKKQA